VRRRPSPARILRCAVDQVPQQPGYGSRPRSNSPTDGRPPYDRDDVGIVFHLWHRLEAGNGCVTQGRRSNGNTRDDRRLVVSRRGDTAPCRVMAGKRLILLPIPDAHRGRLRVATRLWTPVRSASGDGRLNGDYGPGCRTHGRWSLESGRNPADQNRSGHHEVAGVLHQ